MGRMMAIQVSELNIYPVKGLAGISLSNSQMTSRGLAHDRRFMLVDEDNEFLTQREHPQMATIRTTIAAERLSFISAFDDSIDVPLTPAPQTTRIVRVWNSHVHAHSVSADADTWLSEQLGAKVHLVYMPDSSERLCNPQYATHNEIVSFADGFPVLIANAASLADLNTRIVARGGQAIPMSRFRANIVVEGADAWSEDDWRAITIGETIFEAVKPCARCQVTTTDQTTGEVRGPEPLATLSTFREFEKGIMFGINLVPVKMGAVKQSDVVSLQ